MRVGYCVPITPHMASFRLRVAIPAALLGCDYEIGCYGDPTFFYKHFEGDLELADSCPLPFVYDVVNDHFDGKPHYKTMCHWASRVTCSSETMAEIIKKHAGVEATVIDDPWENAEEKPQCEGREIFWFGHAANLMSLHRVGPQIEDLKAVISICTNSPSDYAIRWSPETERRGLERTAVVLVTGDNPGASANRIVKALRAGRFVVTPGGAPAWDAFKPYIWMGNVREGIEWAFANREEACAKISAGQEFVRERNSPQTISTRWMELFDSISERAISGKRAGSASITSTDIVTS